MVQQNALDKGKDNKSDAHSLPRIATQIPFPYPCQLRIWNAVNWSILHIQRINNQEDTSNIVQRGLDGNPIGDGGGGGGFWNWWSEYSICVADEDDLSDDETSDATNDFGRREADASRARNMSWWFRAAFDVDDLGAVGGCVESLLSLGCIVAILFDRCSMLRRLICWWNVHTVECIVAFDDW